MKKIIFIFVVILLFLIIKGVDAYGECSQYGLWAHYDFLTDSCKCTSGYVFSKDLFGNTVCISGDSYCMDKYGYGSTYDILKEGCKCRYGYVWGTDIFGERKCIGGNQHCRDKYGYHSSYDSLSGSCECDRDYFLKKKTYGGYECISGNEMCRDKYGYNSRYNSLSDSCECGYGYELTKKIIGGLECVHCSTKYGYHSSYNSLTSKCECDDGYTLDDDGECVEKQNNVYFILKEVDTDEKQAIIKSEYNYRYYLVSYGYGCYSSSFRIYLNDRIVLNLGTDFDIDRGDSIVLYDDSEVCEIRRVERVDSDYTLEPEIDLEEEYNPPLIFTPPPFSNVDVVNDEISNNEGSQEYIAETNPPKQDIKKIKQVTCGDGYALSLDKKRCIKIPENAHPVENFTDVWLCDDRYKEVGNSCVLREDEELEDWKITVTDDTSDTQKLNLDIETQIESNSSLSGDNKTKGFKGVLINIKNVFKKLFTF